MGPLQFMNTTSGLKVLVPAARYFFDLASGTRMENLSVSSLTRYARTGDLSLQPLESTEPTLVGNFSGLPLVTSDGRMEMNFSVLSAKSRSGAYNTVDSQTITISTTTESENYFKDCTIDFGYGLVRNVVSSTASLNSKSTLVLDYPISLPSASTPKNCAIYSANWQIRIVF